MTGWKDLAARFAGESGKLPLNREALDYLDNLPLSQPVLVACSGGADSVFLVLALLNQLKAAESRLHILHFNHCLRGDASDADEAFVADMAKALGLPFHTGSARSFLADDKSPVPNEKLPVPLDEHSLRSARYGWMGTVYTRLEAGALCLGHHADDLIESQLMALFSGSGPAGMAAPLPVKRFADAHVRVRPLLGLWRKKIDKCLTAIEAPWREDESNSNTAYTRNWIRHQLVPSLRVGFPQDIYAASAHTQTRMKEAVEAIDQFLNSFSLDFQNPRQIDLKPLAGQPRALVRRAIMAWWMRHNPEHWLEVGAVEGLLHAFSSQSKASFSIGENRVLSLHVEATLELACEQPQLPRKWSAGANWFWSAGPLFLPDGSSLTACVVEWQPGADPGYQNADSSTQAWLVEWDPNLEVRQWRAGDRYQPLGAPGRRKLQDLFTDAKLSPEQKHNLPVLLNSKGSILWVPGFPPSEEVRIQPERNSALKLTYHRQ
jgi:tRNA(Ile)-lysidine synthase